MMQLAFSLCQLPAHDRHVHRARQHHEMRRRHATKYKDKAECLGRTLQIGCDQDSTGTALTGWPLDAYQLVGRADIVANLAAVQGADTVKAAAAEESAPPAVSRAPLPARTPMRQPQLRTPAPGGGTFASSASHCIAAQ